jgi:type I restriction enzyme S subunit
MSMPRYPAYKETGINWLGTVPDHWRVERFKLSVESCTNGVWGEEASNNSNDVVCIRVADFDRQKLNAAEPAEPTIRNVSDRDIEARSLRCGDLLIEKSGGGEKQPVGAVVLFTGSTLAVCSNFVARMRLAPGMNPSFWRYAHHAAYSLRVNTKSIKQTSGIQNLDQQQYLDEVAAYPPSDEQEEIANFLDRETAKIDALIAEQQRLIELLQEKRQAVISHAVTKGLNPNAPMKDSGVEWLGEVPEHWEVGQLRRFTKTVKTGRTPDESDFTEEDSSIPWFTPGSFDGGMLTLEAGKHVSVQSVNEGRANIFSKDAVLVVGIGATLGKVAVPGDACSGNQQINAIEPSGRLASWFLGLFLSATQEQMRVSSNASTLGIMNQQKTKELIISCPPLVEQEQIIAHIGKILRGMLEMSEQCQCVVELLQERRSALISAAVTGQIDVRGLVPEAVAQ